MENNMNDPLETAKTVAEKKASAKVTKLLLMGFLAGLLIAFAALASTIASINLLKSSETYGLGKLIQGLVFSGGLIMVVLTGAELFTGNNLMLIALFDRRISVLKLLRNWGLVYLGNLLGSLFLAFLVAFSGIFKANSSLLGESFASIALAKISLDFIPALILGLLCNVLVCLAVYMAFGAKTTLGKLFACIFPVTFFVMCGFEHSIANMFYIPAGFLFGNMFDISAFLHNLLPVTLGNILGGLILSFILYFSSKEKKPLEKTKPSAKKITSKKSSKPRKK
ncbi:formate/nitrite transporter family protein [Candidatus Saccharibacteria bacterium]|nr:formate/nitrite transporter family protein [Candidatus Saccharibacteria bacterium]